MPNLSIIPIGRNLQKVAIPLMPVAALAGILISLVVTRIGALQGFFIINSLDKLPFHNPRQAARPVGHTAER